MCKVYILSLPHEKRNMYIKRKCQGKWKKIQKRVKLKRRSKIGAFDAIKKIFFGFVFPILCVDEKAKGRFILA